MQWREFHLVQTLSRHKSHSILIFAHDTLQHMGLYSLSSCPTLQEPTIGMWVSELDPLENTTSCLETLFFDPIIILMFLVEIASFGTIMPAANLHMLSRNDLKNLLESSRCLLNSSFPRSISSWVDQHIQYSIYGGFTTGGSCGVRIALGWCRFTSTARTTHLLGMCSWYFDSSVNVHCFHSELPHFRIYIHSGSESQIGLGDLRYLWPAWK